MPDAPVPAGTKVYFDVDHAYVDHLNGECVEWAGMDAEALREALRAQGETWYTLVTERCPHLFAAAPVYITPAQLRQMRAVIAAVERVVALPGWCPLPGPLPSTGEGIANAVPANCLGAFMGYDFHLNEEGAHLIEINTNAGGGFLNELLLDSQSEADLYGAAPEEENLEQTFLDMFHNEWMLARGNAPLARIAIVDERPEEQYLYPEFLLAQKMFERAGITVCIVDPSAFEAREDGLYLDEQKIDLVYNRLTDFSLQQHAALRQAYLDGSVVVTPNPAHYARYADKRNLVRLTDADALRVLGATAEDIATLQEGVPQARLVSGADHDQWWQERKHWFFKPATGYGGKGSYNGAKVTKRVFEEIMHDGYVAQRIAAPGERTVCLPGAESQALKYDVRCYVYAGELQLVAARLYQGQTTNFRTPGGGFAVVRVIE